MQANWAIAAVLMLSALLHGCGGAGTNSGGGGGGNPTAAPSITSRAAQNGAVVVSLTSTTSGATIYYTVDGSAPSASSPQYQAPFLVASNLSVKAIAIAGGISSTVATQSFSPNIASGTLVWSDEFSNSTAAIVQPDSTVWTY